jgi:hypothetical protein
MANHSRYGFNPEFAFGHSGIKMSLTEVCHSVAIDVYRQSGRDDESYLNAYFATMRKLYPSHPALQDACCGKDWGLDRKTKAIRETPSETA